MDDMSRSHAVRVYPIFRPGVVRETLLDKIKRFLRIGHPYQREKKEAAPAGCWSRGWVYAYVPGRSPR